MDMNLLAAIAIILLLAIVGIAILTRRRRSGHLAHRFGPGYERTGFLHPDRALAKDEASGSERERRNGR